MAAPFVQGQLERWSVSVEVETACAQSGRAFRIEVDDALRWRCADGPDRPMVFQPRVDWMTFEEPTIVHRY